MSVFVTAFSPSELAKKELAAQCADSAKLVFMFSAAYITPDTPKAANLEPVLVLSQYLNGVDKR